jgi:hypothetical protein
MTRRWIVAESSGRPARDALGQARKPRLDEAGELLMHRALIVAALGRASQYRSRPSQSIA